MRKASEKGHFHITAFLVENGVDPQSLTNATGIVHFNILDHWMRSIVGDLGVRPSDDRKIQMVATAYPVGPPTWGYDGSLVARTSDFLSQRSYLIRHALLLVICSPRAPSCR
jgi:hypothetical protein